MKGKRGKSHKLHLRWRRNYTNTKSNKIPRWRPGRQLAFRVYFFFLPSSLGSFWTVSARWWRRKGKKIVRFQLKLRHFFQMINYYVCIWAHNLTRLKYEGESMYTYGLGQHTACILCRHKCAHSHRRQPAIPLPFYFCALWHIGVWLRITAISVASRLPTSPPPPLFHSLSLPAHVAMAPHLQIRSNFNQNMYN